MNILNTLTKVLFCSLLLISTASLADRRHSDHRGDSQQHTNASQHQQHNAVRYSTRSHGYVHNQYGQARKHWNKHHNKHQYHGHFKRQHSQHSYRPKYHTYNSYRPSHSSYYYQARRLNSALRHYNHRNHGLRVHLSF